MSVLKRRDRIVYFRLSDDEFEQLAELCRLHGARSFSDLARLAIQHMAQETTGSVDFANVLRRLDEGVNELNRKMMLLSDAVIEIKENSLAGTTTK